MIKVDWFKPYPSNQLPATFDFNFQSWDTANKPTELSDYSVCITIGVKDKHLYVLNVLRKRLDYPGLKRAVREQRDAFNPRTILIEDKASGTQLIQELVNEGVHEIKRYEPTTEKTMRMHTVTGPIENGFVHLPDKAPWLAEYLLELTSFPNAKYDDQADATSQALDWFKHGQLCYGVLEYNQELARREAGHASGRESQAEQVCPKCKCTVIQRVFNEWRCAQCGMQWGAPPPQRGPTRRDVLNGTWPPRRDLL